MTIISFCDYTATAVRDWAEAGYDCWCIDMQHPRGVTQDGRIRRVGALVEELHPWHRWMPDPLTVAGVMCWPDCTHMAYSGQRWRRENGPTAAANGFALFARCWDLCRVYERVAGAWWMIENPDGLPCSWCKPDYSFDPCDYGDPYTKRTNLWTGGGFVMPRRTPVLPTMGSMMHLLPPGPDRANQRSATPAGFARALFEANHRKAGAA